MSKELQEQHMFRKKILSNDDLNVTSLAVLSHGTICFTVLYNMKFGNFCFTLIFSTLGS